MDAYPPLRFWWIKWLQSFRPTWLAEEMLRTADGVQSGPGMKLSASVSDDDRKFQAVISRAVLVAAGESGGFQDTLKLQRPSGAAPYLVTVTPMPPSSFELWNQLGSRARILVQVMRPGELGDVKENVLREIYGFTIAETRVAILIGKGLSAPEAAEVLGVTVHYRANPTCAMLRQNGLAVAGSDCAFVSGYSALNWAQNCQRKVATGLMAVQASRQPLRKVDPT
jgi:hypothetical protein